MCRDKSGVFVQCLSFLTAMVTEELHSQSEVFSEVMCEPVSKMMEICYGSSSDILPPPTFLRLLPSFIKFYELVLVSWEDMEQSIVGLCIQPVGTPPLPGTEICWCHMPELGSGLFSHKEAVDKASPTWKFTCNLLRDPEPEPPSWIIHGFLTHRKLKWKCSFFFLSC